MGHTQHTLAVALRMGKHGWQTISGWENGKTPIPGPVQIAMEHLAHCPEQKTDRKALGKHANESAPNQRGNDQVR